MKITIPSHTENPDGLHQKYIISKADGTELDPDGIYLVFNMSKTAGGLESLAARKAAMSIVYAYEDVARRDSVPVPTWVRELNKLVTKLETEDI